MIVIKDSGLVFEFASRQTYHAALTRKMRLYAELGVREYFIFGPTDSPSSTLLAFELVGHNSYLPMLPLEEELTINESMQGGAVTYESELLK